jgi:hypothetical protein
MDPKVFQIIPGVGKSLARDISSLGYKKVSDLKKADPHKMYRKLCRIRGQRLGRCVLYVFRCAVYFASHKKHDPKLLKWWKWKEREK